MVYNVPVYWTPCKQFSLSWMTTTTSGQGCYWPASLSDLSRTNRGKRFVKMFLKWQKNMYTYVYILRCFTLKSEKPFISDAMLCWDFAAYCSGLCKAKIRKILKHYWPLAKSRQHIYVFFLEKDVNTYTSIIRSNWLY